MQKMEKKRIILNVVVGLILFVCLTTILRTTIFDMHASTLSKNVATRDEIVLVNETTIQPNTQVTVQPTTQAATKQTETEVSTHPVETTVPTTEEETTEVREHWDGPVLNPNAGVVEGPSGKETYYNLDMTGVVSIMKSCGYDYEYWIRDDGVKMYGDYVMCAANLDVHPRGTLVESSLGTAIVCDTGGFAESNPNQLDIATNW
jgi:hypothetical protein